MDKKSVLLKKSYLSPEVEDLLSIRNPDPMETPRTPGAATMLSILAVQGMIAVESIRRYGGITRKITDAFGKPGRGHRELSYLQ